MFERAGLAPDSPSAPAKASVSPVTSVSKEFALARSFLDSMLQTERATQDELDAYQGELLARLCRHAAENVPFYRGRCFPDTPAGAASRDWAGQPFVTRSDLAGRFAEFRATQFPASHGASHAIQTGGSTGRPARRDMSSLESLARIVCTYRMFLAWQLDMSRPLYMLRKPQLGSDRIDGPAFRKWGFPWLDEDTLGARRYVDIETAPAAQLRQLADAAPVYVNTLPSNILRLGLEARRTGLAPSIPFIVSVAEFLSPEVKSLAAEVFASRLINILSSAEGGVIAIECPESGLMHVQSEQVLSEIIGEDGNACRPGEVGELVVTPLYNYVTPLIRYRTGDFVEQGPSCPCGRVLPTIARVVGRREHMFLFADGTRALPPVDRVRITELLGHEQWVLAQTGAGTAELRVAGQDAGARAPDALHEVSAALGDGFDLKIREVASLPLTSGGKRHFTVNELS